MIDALIRWSLHNKLIVLTLATIVIAWGGWQAVRLPVDVLPDLTAPTVTILVEGHGRITVATVTALGTFERIDLPDILPGFGFTGNKTS